MKFRKFGSQLFYLVFFMSSKDFLELICVIEGTLFLDNTVFLIKTFKYSFVL